VPGSRLKGVDKPVDGQKDARPPVCPPRAAFPHTHRRNGKFKEKAQEQDQDQELEESNIPVGRPFLRLPAAIRREKKEKFSNDTGCSQNCSLPQ
jgi:hypothetical protein